MARRKTKTHCENNLIAHDHTVSKQENQFGRVLTVQAVFTICILLTGQNFVQFLSQVDSTGELGAIFLN
ncbi:hypothetical protein BpHYR1_034179 [Brachionus plicatilis]|uniref:Uncharacterized protein n=1 Tax=Brachionus plicatilis TaxID=10195 RepID=A0A3M7QJV7_BRAPC|nr:hypothetical protein BpHYR1_034179 [Brachionus plicatilis]